MHTHLDILPKVTIAKTVLLLLLVAVVMVMAGLQDVLYPLRLLLAADNTGRFDV